LKKLVNPLYKNKEPALLAVVVCSFPDYASTNWLSGVSHIDSSRTILVAGQNEG